MKKKLQIFISSTYTDLIEERQAAVSAVLKAGHIPAGMELFTAGDESQMETIKRWIDESDVFMLILGGRYGSIEPNSSLSYTELEYDYAVESGMPYFSVVIEDSALEKKVREYGTSVIETKNTNELEAFRGKVLNRMSAFYSDVQDIRLSVYETISDFLARHDFKGWVSGSEIPDIQSFTDQINKLREENRRLTEANESLSAGTVFASSEDREFDYIRRKLDRDISISIGLHKQREDNKGSVKIATEVYSVNLLSVVISFLGKGQHSFGKRSIEHHVFDALNDKHPPEGAPEIKRPNPFNTIRENLALELQTYGLSKFIKVDSHDPANSFCEFTDKMYRLKYWLEFNGYASEIRFEFVSKTEEAIVESPPPPTPKEKDPTLQTIKQIDSALSFKARRHRWHTSKEGVESAQREYKNLCEELEREVDKRNTAAATFKIEFSRIGENQCKMSGMGISYDILWRHEYPDRLDDSYLAITGDKKRFIMDGISFNEEGAFFNSAYDIDVNEKMEIVWNQRGDQPAQTSNELAKFLLQILIDSIRNRAIYGK